MISISRSWLRHWGWFTALLLGVVIVVLPRAASARTFGAADTSPPTVVYTIDGITGTNSWYRGSLGGNYVVVHWSVSDPDSPISSTSGCEPAIKIDGPNAGTTRACSATSDGGTTTVTTKAIKIDADPPTAVTAGASRSPDSNGWYNHALTIGWSGSDATSGIASCSSFGYSGPDVSSASPSGSCTDKAGNSSGTVSFGFKYDGTAPLATVAASRGPDVNGWYNGPLTIAWSGSDATSGIAACSSLAYSGPDTGSAAPSGSCADKAGNSSAPLAFPFKYDGTAPGVNASADRGPDVNGWYNHALSIGWSGSDATSGISSCSAQVNYSGPDNGSVSLGGSCTDKAGNSAGAAFPFRYDDTAPLVSAASPSRAPDQNDWYNHMLSIGWSGGDVTSGIGFCTSLDYSGPDSADASVSGGCTDKAGNSSAPLPLAFKYDATAPAVTVTPDRAPDANGWYNHAVTIGWSGSDATSGLSSCSPPIAYGGPDSAAATLNGGCTDKAGNSSGGGFALKYDDTGPTVAVSAERSPDANGWFNHPFTIAWTGSDAASGIAACSSLRYNGPDTSAAAPSGGCADKAGNSASLAIPFKYDATAPLVSSATPSRPPDEDGWYNHALSVTWSGSDAAAGLASCTSLVYGGPDSAAASVSGNCIDRAGNESNPLAFALRYDETPPKLWAVELRAANRVVVLTWQSSGADAVQITRTPGKHASTSTLYAGKAKRFSDRNVENGVRYRYSLRAVDAAGNSATRTVAGIPRPELFAPAPEAHLRPRSSILFAWLPDEQASYYNLQLWLDGRVVAAWWPPSARFRLHSPWHFRGRLHRLEPGRYTWYVWPGRGPRRLGHYGRLLGKSSFVVKR